MLFVSHSGSKVVKYRPFSGGLVRAATRSASDEVEKGALLSDPQDHDDISP
jgi:hypothetical protein